MLIHPARQALIALLNFEEAFGTVPTKYLYYTDIQRLCFLKKSAAGLPKYTNINDYIISLEAVPRLHSDPICAKTQWKLVTVCQLPWAQ